MALSSEALSRIASFVTNNLSAEMPDSVDHFGGIIGGEEPSRYSSSPHLWNSLFRLVGTSGYFGALDLPGKQQLTRLLGYLTDLPECVDITITSPYKAAAYECLDQLPRPAHLTERVRRLQCLNHIIPERRTGTLFVDNTDGQGMIRALEKRRALQNARVLLVGAGGAAASIGYELVVAGAQLTIANIIPDEAVALKALLDPLTEHRATVGAGGWELIEETAPSSEVIISAITASSPLTESEFALLPADCLCADTRYGSNGLFAEAARRAGRSSIDGREMLFGQFQLAAERVGALLEIDPQLLSKTFSIIEQEFTA